MRIWGRFGPLFAVVLLLNLVPTVSAPSIAMADERPSLTYFALGDSYASGHGLAGDNEGTDPCRLSSQAYPAWVSDGLSEAYTFDEARDFHHLACSGATAAPFPGAESKRKYLGWQADVVYQFLDERDSEGATDPVLVTITIGANDGLLKDWLRQFAAGSEVLRRFQVGSATRFFEYVDVIDAYIASNLTPVIDSLMSYENVYVVLTDYPNPFPDGAFGDGTVCNDWYQSLSCEEAMNWVFAMLSGVMLDQFIRINQPDRLRVATLGETFSSHPAVEYAQDCVTKSLAPDSWFQQDCAHPNLDGAQAIADVVLDRVEKMLPSPGIAQPSGEQYNLIVGANNCDGLPVTSATSCEPAVGVKISVTTASGEWLGSCTTSEPSNWHAPYGLCGVPVPFDTTVIVTEDVSTIPAGYAPLENPISFESPSEIVDGVNLDVDFWNGPQGAHAISAAAPTAQEVANGGLWALGIAARTEGAGYVDHTIGARFIVTSEDGEYIGECTLTEPPDRTVPWWNCKVDVPSDRISLVWVDLDSIPAGYAPVENPITFDPTTYETGPHNIGAMFVNVPVNGDSSGSSSSAEATLLMTFRGCPEGFDPNTDDFYATCTIPLDAPDASIIAWGGDGQGGMNITGLDRQYNGEYVYTAGPNTMNLQLSGLAPVVRDGYQVFGADGVNGDTYTVNLVDGETREIFVFYYYE